jgi:hypothetical protein
MAGCASGCEQVDRVYNRPRVETLESAELKGAASVQGLKKWVPLCVCYPVTGDVDSRLCSHNPWLS